MNLQNKLPRSVILFTVFFTFFIAALTLGVGYYKTHTWNFPSDDPYIYLQYVKNAADGHWFQYNLGEHSGGMTGFLWYILLVIIYKPLSFLMQDTHALIWSLHILSTLTTLGALLLAAELIYWRTQSARLASLAAPLSLLFPQYLWASWGGLEGPAAAFISIFAARLFISEIIIHSKPKYSGFLAGFFYWVRPESILIPFCWLGTYLLLARKSFRTNFILSFCYLAPVIILFLLVAGIYFYFTGYFTQSAIVRLHFWDIIKHPAALIDMYHYFKEWLLLSGALTLILGIQFLKNKNYLAEFVMGWGLLFLILSDMLLGIFPNVQDRYLSWMTPLMVSLFLISVHRMTLTTIVRLFLKQHTKQFFGALIVFFSLAHTVSYSRTVVSDDIQCMNDVIVAVGDWINTHLANNVLIASEPIGSTKLFGQRKFFDIVGVTTPIARGTYQHWDKTWQLIKEAKAEYFIFSEEGLPKEGYRFLTPVKTFYGPTCKSTYKTNAIYRVHFQG